MGTIPIVGQGALNRIATHLVVANYTNLNVTPSYLGKNQIAVHSRDPASKLLPTATGGVSSPEPYQFWDIDMDLLKSQVFSWNWLTQMRTNCNLGPITAYSDAPSTWQPMQFKSAQLVTVDPEAFDGDHQIVRVRLEAVYEINSILWG